MIPSLVVSTRAIALGCFIFACVLRGSVAAQELATDSPGPSAASDGWYAGIASGWYFPIQAWPTTYQLGGGGMFLVGAQINPHWAVQFDLNMWLFSGNGRDTWDLKTGPVLVWTPSARRIAPFFLAGMGVDFQTTYPEQVSRLAPMTSVGGGVRFAMGARSGFFVEVRHHFVLRPVTTRDVPVLVGFRLGF